MNNIIATIFSSLYQQIVLIASCLFILQLPLEKWRNRRTLITFFLSWIPIFLIQNFNNNWVLPSLFLLLGIFSLALHIITGCRYSNIWSSGTCLFAGFLKAYAEFPSLSVILSFFFSPCWLFCAA